MDSITADEALSRGLVSRVVPEDKTLEEATEIAKKISAMPSLTRIDGQSLRTYRHAPNTGSRKSWAAGDATSRGVRLAWLVKQGEMGYPSALSAKKWGFYDTLWQGKPFKPGTFFDNLLHFLL